MYVFHVLLLKWRLDCIYWGRHGLVTRHKMWEGLWPAESPVRHGWYINRPGHDLAAPVGQWVGRVVPNDRPQVDISMM